MIQYYIPFDDDDNDEFSSLEKLTYRPFSELLRHATRIFDPSTGMVIKLRPQRPLPVQVTQNPREASQQALATSTVHQTGSGVLPPIIDFQQEYESAVDAFNLECLSDNLSKSTVEYYSYPLKYFKEYMVQHHPTIGLKGITKKIIQQFLVFMRKQRNEKTELRCFRGVKAFFTFCDENGLVEESPMKAMHKPKTTEEVIKPFTTDQVQAMLNACGNDLKGTCVYAVIYILFDTGLRIGELCNLRIDDVDWERRMILVRVAKNKKERYVPFGVEAKAALQRYLTQRGRVNDSDYVFVRPGEKLPLNRGIVNPWLKECGDRAQVKGVRVSPHTFRHTFAVTYLLNEGDSFSLQELLGHSSMEMTKKYVKFTERALREKHRLCSPGDSLARKNCAG